MESIKSNMSVKEKYEIFAILWGFRKSTLMVVGTITALSIAFSLMLPNYYRSSAVLMPSNNQTKLGGLSGLSSLASIAGISVGDASVEQLYPDIIKSESILHDVIYSKYHSKNFSFPVNLIEYWEIDEDDSLLRYEIALKRLQKEIEVSADKKTNIVNITLLMKEPQLAADVVNRAVFLLDNFMKTKRTTSAKEQKKWIESRLLEVESDLKKSEEVLTNFREKNRSISNSPQLLLQEQRLTRDIEINDAMFVELKKQYEIAKIEEIKDIPVINILDPARPAAKKDKPTRSVIVLLSFFFSFLGSIFYKVIIYNYGPDIVDLLNVFRSTAKIK